jgi:hypothetical protein
MTLELTAPLASKFAAIALGHVGREYPSVVQHVMEGPADAQTLARLHPVFHGSFDWHSCVHAHWMLARLLRAFPDLPEAPAIAARFDSALSPDGVAAEAAYFSHPPRAGFERPYGWAWLLMLAAELRRHEDDHARWEVVLRPLTEVIVARLTAFLPKADYPIRAGVHSNTAFALILAQDYAAGAGDEPLAAMIRAKARAWYGEDAGCQAWEPSGDDFLSSALSEAELMRRVMAADAFRQWLDRFLPDLAAGRPSTLFAPARVSDRADGKIAHLDGLNLSRAWCWRGLASALEESHPARALALRAAQRHLAASLPHVADDYMGEHWLATFAVLALEAGQDHPCKAGVEGEDALTAPLVGRRHTTKQRSDLSK